MQLIKISISSLLVVSLTVICGCSGNLPGQVSGTVQLEGEPLTRGTVTLHPKNGGAVAYGQIDAQGNYQVKTGQNTGIEPGEYIITVVALEELELGDDQAGEQVPEPITHAAYSSKDSSPLTVTVKPGSNEHAIILDAYGK